MSETSMSTIVAVAKKVAQEYSGGSGEAGGSVDLAPIRKEIADNVGKIITLDYIGTLVGNQIVFSLAPDIASFELLSNVCYSFNLIADIPNCVNGLSRSYEMVIETPTKEKINLLCIYQNKINKTSTVGDFGSIQKYIDPTGFVWRFSGIYKEIQDATGKHKVIYTNDISRETNPSMTGKEIYDKVQNGSLEMGSTILCTEDYKLNGYEYTKGHTYYIEGNFDIGELQAFTHDISPCVYNGVKVLSGQTVYTIDDTIKENNIIIYGDVTNLVINKTKECNITVKGKVTAYSLPNTQHTINLSIDVFDGTVEKGASTALKEGSKIGKYLLGCVIL